MTLPPACLKTETAAKTNDPFAGLGLPDSPSGADAAPSDAPFSSVLTQVDSAPEAPTAAPPAAPVPAPAPFVFGQPVLYPSLFFRLPVSTSTAAASATAETVPSEILALGPDGLPLVTNSPAQPAPSSPRSPRSDQKQKSASPTAAEENAATSEAAVLTYQLIAGLWVPQPPPVVPVEAGTSDATRLGTGVEGATSFSPTQQSEVNISSLGGKISEPRRQAGGAVMDSPEALASPGSSSKSKPLESARNTSAPFQPLAALSSATPLNVAATEIATPLGSSVVPVAQTPAVSEAASGVVQTASADQFEAALEVVQNVPLDAKTSLLRRGISAASRPNSTPAEKIAAPGLAVRVNASTEVNPSFVAGEKKTVIADGEEVSQAVEKIGTSAANREFPMLSPDANKPSAEVFPVSSPVVSTEGMPAAISADKVGPAASAAAQAPRLVQEIHAIADRVSQVTPHAVEMRFDFSANDRLAVRVEYRDGTVHTTFMTDSSQVREAVSHEWQGQAVGEPRSYRLAEPVFSSTTSSGQQFSSSSGGSGQQRAFDQSSQFSAPSYAGSGRNLNFTSQAGAPTPASARVTRPETSLHLHAHA